jgi:hypothetical protein
MSRGNAPAAVENGYPTSGLTATSDYNKRAGFRYGTFETGIIRFGRDPNGQAWFVVDKPRRGSTSGRSVHLTKEVARQMRDTLDALLKRRRYWGRP